MKQPKQTGKRQTANSLSSYVYVIRVDGVVRYIGKGRNGRLYSHMIEAQRTANRPGVKIANLSPHFRKMLVSAVRRGANIKEKIITAKLTADAAYAIERHMVGSFHKNHPGQLWNTIDERFMSPEYLPDDWSNPVHPLYKVRRPLIRVDRSAAFLWASKLQRPALAGTRDTSRANPDQQSKIRAAPSRLEA